MTTRGTVGWAQPPPGEHPLRQTFGALWSGRWLLVGAILASVLGAAVFVSRTEEVYEASADLLVAPVPNSDTTFNGLSVLRASDEPSRNVQTVVRLLRSDDIARRTAAALDLDSSPQQILSDITVTPIAQSDIVTITARAGTPGQARRLADGFARAGVAHRTDRLKVQVDTILEQLSASLAGDAMGESARSGIVERIAALKGLRSGGDPTLTVARHAELPTSPVAPRRMLSLLVGAAAGALVGVGIVLLRRVLDPRVEREAELRSLLSVPVVARVSGRGHRDRRRHRARYDVRALLAFVGNHAGAAANGRVVVVSSLTRDRMKTDTAVELARTLAETDKRVLLMDADVYHCGVASEFGVRPTADLWSLILGESTLEASLQTPHDGPRGIRLLAPARPEISLDDALADGAARPLVQQGLAACDWMVVDAPPLDRSPSAIKFAGQLLVVVRLGATRVDDVRRLADALQDRSEIPIGLVLVARSRHIRR